MPAALQGLVSLIFPQQRKTFPVNSSISESRIDPLRHDSPFDALRRTTP
jgi:hypothetical protein